MDNEQDLEKEGILRVPLDATKGAEENRKMREHHNANHALWYLTMIVHAITHEKEHQNTRQKTERVLAHLSHLREFIHNPDRHQQTMIEQIFELLLSENPSTHAQWTRFMYAHWNLIQNFADHYGHKDKCFPDAEFEKIDDIVHHRKYFKVWWWRIRLEDGMRRLRGAWRHKNKRPDLKGGPHERS